MMLVYLINVNRQTQRHPSPEMDSNSGFDLIIVDMANKAVVRCHGVRVVGTTY